MLARIVVEDKHLSRVSLVQVTRDAEHNNVRLVAPDSADGRRLYGKLKELSQSAGLTLDGQELVLLDEP